MKNIGLLMLTLNLSDVIFENTQVNATFDINTCGKNTKVTGTNPNEACGTACTDYIARKGDTAPDWTDCAAAVTACGTAVKKDGTCAASRAECEVGSTTSFYYYIDGADDKKCKKKTQDVCEAGSDKKLDTDGTCAAACNATSDNYKKDNASTCEYDSTCTGAKGIKKDGTCADTRATCNDSNGSLYWYVDTNDLNKCKLKTQNVCEATASKKLMPDGTCAAACNAKSDNYTYDDASTCKYKTDCTVAKGLKADGTCSTNRDDCNGAGADSDYYYIDTNDRRKCKLKTQPTCEAGSDKKLDVDGTCAATCGSDNYKSEESKTCKYATCTSPKGIKKSDGTCVDRAACNGAGALSNGWYIDAADRRKCKEMPLATCQGDGNKKLSVEGVCVAACNVASNYQSEDTGGNAGKCIYKDCTAGTKGLKTDGTCADTRSVCNGAGDLSNYYYIDSNDYNKCKKMDTATCAAANSDNIYIKTDGTCVAKCEDYILGDDTTKECADQKCKDASKWTNFDGSCTSTNGDCKAYSKKDATNDKKCIKDSCTADQYLKTDGTCAANAAACGDYFRGEVVNTEKRCVQDTCASGEYLTYDGKCVAEGKCPQGSRQDLTATSQAKKCYRNDCASGSDKWWDLEGKCVASCSAVARTYADETDGKRCKQDTCDAISVLQDDGKCKKCGDYIKAKAGNLECETSEFTCSGDREYLGALGVCKTCDAFSKIAENKKSCDNPNCLNGGNSKTATTAAGECVEDAKCPSWSKLSSDGAKKCIETDCSNAADSKNWVGMDGECYATGACPDYTKKQTTSPNRCTQETCTSVQKLKTDGTCENCAEYKKSSDDGKSCVDPGCTNQQFYTPDGVCHDTACPEHYKSDSVTAAKCVKKTHACAGESDQSKVTGWYDDAGTCVEKCPEYDLKTDSPTKLCSTVATKTCKDQSMVLGRDGKCTATCPIYEFKDTTQDKCIAPKTDCKDQAKNKILGVDGQCVEKCPDYAELDASNVNDKKCKAATSSCGAKILLLDGTCAEKCPDYDALDESGGMANKKCVKGATCSNGEVLGRDGKCTATCPTYEFKNTTSGKCEVVSCDKEPTNKNLSRTGTCVATCPDYDEAVAGKCTLKNVSDCTGNNNADKLHVDGKCMTACPEFYEDLNSDRKCTLFTKDCSSEATKKLLTNSKTCVEKCDDYLFTDDTKKQCQTVTCESNLFLTLDGKCEAKCPEFHEEDSQFKGKCKKSVNKCAATSQLLISVTNTCVDSGKCTRYLKEDLANNQCQTVTCSGDKKVLKGDGTCDTKCPDYEFLDESSKCTIPTCKEGEKLTVKGVCGKACPEFYEDANADGKCTLFPDHKCGDAAPYEMGDKTCVKKCPDFLKLEDTKKRCETVVCDGKDLLQANGTCVSSCPDYFAKSADEKRCEQATCEGATKLLKIDGACAATCPDYQKASNDGKKCEAQAACTGSKKLHVTAECLDACPAFYKDSDDGKQCVKKTNSCKTAQDDKKLSKADGTCVKTCDDFQFTAVADAECRDVTCAKYLTLNGICLEACPQLTTNDGGKCKAVTNNCTSGKEYNTADGCVESCPKDAYVRAFTGADTKKSCIQDVCLDTEVLKKADGTCTTCEKYTKRVDAKTCKADTCKAREKLLDDGTCGACPDYQVTKGTVGTSKECEQPTCEKGNEYVAADGTCTACADYFLTDDTKRDCKPGNLKNLGEGKKPEQFILQKDGTAKECEFAKPDASKIVTVNGVEYKTECKATVCNADVAETAVGREIVNKEGGCDKCPDKQKTDPKDDQKCAEVVCEKAGWGPNLEAVCVDLQLQTVDKLPEGVTKENIVAAQKKLNTMLEQVAATLAALESTVTAGIKLAFNLS